MKSSFLEKSKRALVLLLTGAMIATAVPSTAFAATVADDDVIIEEVTDAVAEDAVVEEEVVATEPSDVVEALGAEEVVEGDNKVDDGIANSVDADEDAVSRTLGITDPDNAADLNNSTASLGKLANLKYGTEFDPIVFKSRATIGTTTADYEKVTWSVLKYIDEDIADPAVKNADANLTDATADLTALGLKWTTSGNSYTGLTMSISGDPAPKKFQAAKTLVIRTVGTENTENRKVLPVSLAIGKAAVTTAGGTINFGTSAMGYDVLDKTPNPIPETPYTVAQKTTLTSTTMAAYKITDLKYELSGPDASAFTVVAPTGADAELYSGHPVTVVVEPIPGLSSKGDKAPTVGDGEYKATLTVKSASLAPAGETVADLKFTVTSNLKFASATKNGGTALTTAEIAADPALLGKIKVGETFNQTVVTATGGNGKITITKTGDAFPKNITGTASNTANTATYTISGQIPTVNADDSTTIGNYNFKLALSDEEGNDVAAKNFRITVESADLGLSIDGEDLQLGANNYAWNAATGYTPSSEAKTVRLVNNSPIELTVNAVLSGLKKGSSDSTNAFALSSGASEMIIPAGGVKTFTITPGPAQKAAAPDKYTGTLTLSGKGITATPISLTFTENANTVDFDITKPAADNDTITGGFVGRDYSYKFGYTKDDNASVPAWTIDDSATTATVLKNTYGLELNKTTGELKGVPKATTPVSPGYIAIKVNATYTRANGTSKTVSRTARLTIVAPKDAFTLASGGTTLDQNHGLDLGAKKSDEQVKTEFTIHNNTKADIAGVKATVAATNNIGADVSSKFRIIYSDDSTMQTHYNTNGLTIKADETATVRLESDVPMTADKKYTATVTVASAAVDGPTSPLTAYAFSESFSVTDVPTITATAVTGFTVGTEITSATKKYSATLAGATLPVFLYSWEPADATSEFNISNSGLTLRDDGVVVGKPNKAGKYKVKVTVTEQNSGSVGTLTHDLTVGGSVALTAFLENGGTDVDVDGKAVVLPGAFAGEAAKQTLQFYATPAAATNNVKITVADADDNRSESERDADPKNPYKGSAEFIEAVPSSFASVGADQEARFYLKTKGNPEAGTYKVKVTITSDEATTAKTFNAYLNVVDKLTIKVPTTATANIAEQSIINLSAEGGYAGQTITWSEVGTKEKPSDLTKKYYVTADGTIGAAGVTGLKLTSDGVNGYAAAIGGSSYGDKGIPEKAGNFDVYLKATASGTTMPAYNAVDAPKGFREGVNLVYNDAKALPEQNSDEAKLALTVGKTNKIAVGKADQTIAVDTSDDSNNVAGIQGTKLGSSFSKYTGYTYKNKMSAAEAGTIAITVTNNAAATVNISAIKLSDNSDFEFVSIRNYNDTANFVPGAGTGNLTSGANGFIVIKVKPKATLTAKKTYTDAIQIKGDNMETVTFDLSFTLEDGKYEATVTNQDITPVPTDPEKLAKLKYYVTKNVLGSEPIALTDAIEKKVAPTAETFYVKNEGNTAFYKAKVEEVKANGTTYDDGETRLLTVTGDMAAAAGVTINPDADNTFKLQIANTDTAGTYNAKLRFTFAESAAVGATTKTIDIPVTYTIYNKSVTKLTTTPSSIDFGSTAEGYTPDSLAKTFTVTNTGTAVVDTVSALRVHVDEAAFEISSNTEGVKLSDNQTLLMDKLAPGASATFTIKPIKELSAKTWTANLSVTSANTPATAGEVKFVVTASSKLNLDVFNTARTLDQSVAARLYNTVVIGKGATVDNSTTDHVKTSIKLYGSNDDVDIDFIVDDKNNVSTVTSATIATAATYDVKESSNKITLTAAEEANAKASVVPGGYFTEATFNLYQDVTFLADPNNTSPASVVVFTDKALDLFGSENITIYTGGASPAYAGATLATTKPAKAALISKIVASVKVGQKLGTAFPEGNFPEAKAVSKPFGYWQDATPNEIDQDTKIAGVATVNGDLTAEWHSHQLPDDDEKDESLVKWAWEGSASTGYTDATLTLHCANACPNEDKGELVVASDDKRSTTADKRWATITQLVKITTKTKDGDCTHGSRTEYTAEAKVGGKTYKSTQIADEDPSTKVGHKYNTTISWKKQDDGSYKPEITQKCTVCDTKTENHDFTATVFTVDTKVDKEPTCTEKGKTTYTLTSFVDGNGKTVSTADIKKMANNSYEAATDAKGHKAEFEFSEADTEKLTAKAVVKCSVCHEELYNGSVKLKDNGNGSYAVEVTGKDGNKYNGEYVDHVHEWKATWAEWKRTDPTDKFSWSTSLTLTCNKGTKPETKTPEVTISKTTEDKYVDYVATATFEGSTYTSEIFTVDAETGEPTEKHTHVWVFDPQSVEWTPATGHPTSATATFTCSVGSKPEVRTVDAVISSEIKGKNTLWTATFTSPAPAVVKTATKRLNTATGEEATADNPEFEATNVWNLFYTDDYEFEIDSNVEITDAFTGAGITKGFFSVTNDAGTVTVKVADTTKRKAAAKEANTTFEAPAKWQDAEGNDVAGIYTITIPVEYTKPNLKLSSTSANFFTTATSPKTQTVGTSILVQNKDGVYQSMNLDDYNIDIENSAQFVHSGGLKVNKDASETEYGYVAFDATGKASGKIGIQGENWAEKVQLAYNVKEQKKHTLTVGGKTSYTVTLNSKAPGVFSSIAPAIDGVYTSTMDNLSAEELEKLITITPKKVGGPNVFFNGDGLVIVRNDKDNEDGTVSPIVAKGSFSYELVDSNGSKAKLNVKVVDTDLSKSITLKVKQQMNVITGQDMVVTPTIKNFNGYIKSVEIDGTDGNFDVYYDGSIVVKAKEGAKVNTKDKYTLPLKITVGDFDDEFEITGVSIKNFKIKATTPTLKAQKATFTKQGDNLSINFTSTYKNGAKHLVKIDPDKLVQADTKGNKDNFVALTYEDGDQKGNIIINEDGTFTAKSVSGKAKAFKVTATYNFRNSDGEVLDGSVTKTVSVGTKIKK